MRNAGSSRLHNEVNLVRPAAIIVALSLAAILWVQLGGRAQAEPATTASISVTHLVRGVERTANYAYRFELSCTKPSGAPVNNALAFTLAGGGLRTFSAADMVGLTPQDSCSVRTIDNNGAETTYASTALPRADGSQPDPVPGVIGPGGFVAAQTPADGRTISIVSTFGGDLAISKRVEGAPPGSVAVYELRVACDGGFSRSLLLGDGQQQTITGIAAGARCQVTEIRGGGASPRFQDNSGPPNDGVVTIVATSAACWDLRNSASECRAAVVVTNQFDAATDLASQSVPPTTTQETATTLPNDQAPATAVPVAPAPAGQPAVVSEADIAFTG